MVFDLVIIFLENAFVVKEIGCFTQTNAEIFANQSVTSRK